MSSALSFSAVFSQNSRPFSHSQLQNPNRDLLVGISVVGISFSLMLTKAFQLLVSLFLFGGMYQGCKKFRCLPEVTQRMLAHSVEMQEFEAFSSAGHWVLKKKMRKIMPNVVKNQYIQDCDAIQMLLYPCSCYFRDNFLAPPF